MYLGCSTAGNRTQWALFGFLGLLCAVLWIVSRAERSSCQLCDNDGDTISNCKALRREDWNDWDASVQSTRCSPLSRNSDQRLLEPRSETLHDFQSI